jgi:hypothetical protein
MRRTRGNRLSGPGFHNEHIREIENKNWIPGTHDKTHGKILNTVSVALLYD